MILDQIGNLSYYYSIHPLLKTVDAFLKTKDWQKEAPGKYDIPGTGAWVSLQEVDAHPQKNATAEFHKKYIDLQYVLCGNEMMGWSTLNSLPNNIPFQEKNDCGLIPNAVIDSWIQVKPGFFAIFQPSDVHAPCCGNGFIRKIVVKIPA
ncbi:MAG: YhcH/YjgK/YiaL family protein [Lentisphaeria bacterium]